MQRGNSTLMNSHCGVNEDLNSQVPRRIVNIEEASLTRHARHGVEKILNP